MIKALAVFIFTVSLCCGLPLDERRNLSEKTVAVVPADGEDLKTAETFYSGYNAGYPSLGLGAGPQGGGYGWRGDYKPLVGPVGPVYGPGYEIGYAAIPAGSYGAFGPSAGHFVQAPVSGAVVGGGYGWRQGVNRWAL